MLKRLGGNLTLRRGPVNGASDQLERDGYAVVRDVLSGGEVAALAQEINAVFASSQPDRAHDKNDEWRHEMLNRSPLSQKAIGHPAILAAIEPLLGEDCHVIANTAWRNPPEFQGGPWHVDAGPHVPRPEGVPWDDRIPYPIFAIGAHIYLKDCPLACGPTAVVPGSHRSGRLPPLDRPFDETLTYDGRTSFAMEARAGDVALFVSDAWHRGLPSRGGNGRFFLQAHYGRRDIAQRLKPAAEANQLSPGTVHRATTAREKTLAGLHPLGFYDA